MNHSQNKGTLYLIPNTIADNTIDRVIAPQVFDVVKATDYFIVENVRTARRYISGLKLDKNIDALRFEVIDKKSADDDALAVLDPVLQGTDAGVISEAGCPGIADPGSLIVQFAHQLHIRVVPLSGPSSIFLALMASGFNGQEFAFHGYLPIEKKARAGAIKRLESLALKSNQTQIFMETPYRNEKMLAELLRSCHPDTRLCIAKNITGSSEWIRTASVGYWKKNVPKMHKEPAIFLLGR